MYKLIHSIDKQENCYDPRESYANNKIREEVLDERKYLDSKTCCDNLAHEYEKLANKCHDTFGKLGHPLDDRGKIRGVSLCSGIEKTQDLHKARLYKSVRTVFQAGKKRKTRKSRKSGRKPRITRNR